jgi:hypothetical protein
MLGHNDPGSNQDRRPGMRQAQCGKERRSLTARRRKAEQILPLDPRDPDIIRAKRLQRQQARAEPLGGQ